MKDLVFVFLLAISLAVLVESLLIYRRKSKPKLICREENEWSSNLQESKFVLSTELPLTEVVDSARRKRSNSHETEPVIYLNTTQRINNKNGNEYEFEIVGDELASDEKRILRNKLIHTCTLLNINSDGD